MKIGLVLHPYGEKESAGLGRSIYSLAKNIIEQSPNDHFVIFTKGEFSKKPDFEGDNWEVKALPTGLFWLDRGLLKNDLDSCIFFTPSTPFFANPGQMFVVVHDMGIKYVKTFKNFLIGLVQGYSLKRADKIIAVSEYTRNEIQKFYPQVSPKVKVIYNGYYRGIDGLEEVELPEKFFLFVGVFKARKNVLNIVRAFKELKLDGYDLVLAGKSSGGYGDLVKEEIGDLDNIHILDYVSDMKLNYLFSKASSFVFPSKLEGFGMPILDAMKNSVPVVTSNYGAMKEVAGEAAILVDPDDIIDIASGMRKSIDKREELVDMGLKRAKDFSWEKAGREYISYIHE